MKSSSLLNLSADRARRLILDSQMLLGNPDTSSGRDRTVRIIESLGYIQIDTISVVQRAHHHSIWTRYSGYHPDMLHQLQAVDRKIFEYWGHAASYLPMCDYRYYTYRMRNFSDPMEKWAKDRLKKCGYLMDEILKRIEQEGPLGSKDFKSNPDAKRGQWWDWKPAKTALELLFWRGDLMVTRRDNFQRIYDLTERVLPDGIDTSTPDENELGRFLVRRALKAYGIASMSDIVRHIHAAERKVIQRAVRMLVDEKEVIQVSFEGIHEYFALSDTAHVDFTDIIDYGNVHILSPFDNLIIQRDRTSRYFDFDYRLECYTPREKRQFGYFVLPVIWGTRFVAKLDSKADRKRKILIIRSLQFEEGFSEWEAFLPVFSDKLAEFARFNNCIGFEFENVKPRKIAAPLKRLLKGKELEKADD